MRKSALLAVWILCALTLLSQPAAAHFGMIIPSKDVVGKDDPREIELLLQFTHPFEGGPQMQLDKPDKFGVVIDDKAINLLPTLTERKVDGQSTWETRYKITKPADYVFFMIPKPYWEPAEDKFIIHCTKVIVDALGAEEGWDKPIGKLVGMPVEIVPMTRPYSLYAGNTFSGVVLKDGKPVEDAEVEVEWWGKGKSKAPTDSHVTQVVKADKNGVFHFTMPKAGWWGFAALMEGPKKLKYEGKDKEVEVGAVLWVHTYPME